MNTSQEIVAELWRRFPKTTEKVQYDFDGSYPIDVWVVLRYIESHMKHSGLTQLFFVGNRYDEDIDAGILLNDYRCTKSIFNTESLKEAIIEWFQIQEENTK